MKSITSRDNPTFKELRDQVRRGKPAGQALLEGPHLVMAALDKGLLPNQLVVSASALGLPEVIALLARMPAVPVLCLADALFKDISELEHPSGVLARIAVPMHKAVPACAVPPAPTFTFSGDCLLLDAVQDAGNVGTLLRTAAAAGITDVLLGPGCAGAWTPRVLRAGQGAHFSVRIHEQVDLRAFLQQYPGQSIAAVAHDGQSLYELSLQSPPIAWLLGSEGQGVSPELLALVRRRATIPLVSGTESLNVAAAAAICLFEMRRQRIWDKVGAG